MESKTCTPRLLLTLVFLLLPISGRSQEAPVLFQPALSPRIASYNIEVTLESAQKKLHGRELLFWHNQTSATISELQFHLYLNGFRNTRSTYMLGTSNPVRSRRIKEDGWGYIEVDAISVSYDTEMIPSLALSRPSEAATMIADLTDITPEIEFIQPDIESPDDKSVFSVPLPRPLPPGGKVIVAVDFTAKLPEPPYARTGAKAEYVFAGQWFPKIGVHTDGQWNCHQFHSRTNFFADFGVYNVWITVPEDNVVGATGLEVAVTTNDDGTATHYYHAEDVHDFAWTASPEFVEVTGKSQDVDIRVLMQPDHADQSQRQLEAAKLAVRYFQDWYGDYPFPNLTVVDPRRGAAASGGMEYPTLITVGTGYGIPAGMKLPEMVTIHEFGHNYWYHLLASNEFEESWLDEGINTYTDIQIMPDAYPGRGNFLNAMGLVLDIGTYHRAQYMGLPDADPVNRTSWGFYSGQSYTVNSYPKPGLILTTLQNYLGWDKMLEAMRTYVERWRFRHPKARDFFDVLNEVSGENLDWFFQQAFETNSILDYSVTRVFSREVKPPKGFDHTLSTVDSDTALTRTDKENDSSLAAATDETDTTARPDSSSPGQLYESGVNIRRLGDFKFPVEIEVIFENGETVRESWDGQELWKKLRYTKPTRLVSATVDPDGKIPLDVNLTNNSKTLEKQTLGVNKISSRTLFWLQFLLEAPETMHSFMLLNDIF